MTISYYTCKLFEFETKHYCNKIMFHLQVDVTRILCKIVSRSGLKLSGPDLREPESSATILHVALLYNHADIIDFLVGLRDQDLILAKYETGEYLNQTALHVAVANGDPSQIEKLVLALDTPERLAFVNTIANGHYFRSRHPHGQLCLTAAAWSGNGEVSTDGRSRHEFP